MRCIDQYNSCGVSLELDGSPESPSYIANLRPEERMNNQDDLPFHPLCSGIGIEFLAPYSHGWGLVKYRSVTGNVGTT